MTTIATDGKTMAGVPARRPNPLKHNRLRRCPWTEQEEAQLIEAWDGLPDGQSGAGFDRQFSIFIRRTVASVACKRAELVLSVDPVAMLVRDRLNMMAGNRKYLEALHVYLAHEESQKEKVA